MKERPKASPWSCLHVTQAQEWPSIAASVLGTAHYHAPQPHLLHPAPPHSYKARAPRSTLSPTHLHPAPPHSYRARAPRSTLREQRKHRAPCRHLGLWELATRGHCGYSWGTQAYKKENLLSSCHSKRLMKLDPHFYRHTGS